MKQRKLFLTKFIRPNSIGCEIGVWKGALTEHFLKNLRIKKYYLIDPYEFGPQYPTIWWGGKIAKSQNDMDQIRKEAMSLIDAIDVKCERVWIRKSSEDAVSEIEDESLDWVYIDGNHEYEFVNHDLNAYIKKVKTGGLIMCDDLGWVNDAGKEPVTDAVFDWLLVNKAKVTVMDMEQRQIVMKKL